MKTHEWKQDDHVNYITYGELSVCIEHRSVEVCGEEIDLTAKE